MMSRRMAAVVLAMLLAVASWLPVAEAQAEPPTCQGQDLLARIYAADASARTRVETEAGKISNGDALLWRVSRAGGPSSHLFGTIHLTDARVTKLSEVVLRALDSAKRVALEVVDVTPEAFVAAMGALGDRLVFPEGRSILPGLDIEERETLSAGLATLGFPAGAHGRLRPWFVTMMLAVTACERARLAAGLQPLDIQIGARARERGVVPVSLETLEGQLRVMASVPEDDQIQVLRASLKTHAQTPDAVESMVRRYLAREIATILPMQAEMLRAAGFDPAIMDSFTHALLERRNPGMRDAALPLLEAGDAFIAVGALHLIGETGLVSLLRREGYEVTPVE